MQVYSKRQALLMYEALRDSAVPHIKTQLPEQLEGLDEWREQDKQSMNLYPYAIEGKDYYLISPRRSSRASSG